MLIDTDNKKINVWWMKETDPGNFGDILTPWIIKAMTGYKCNYVWQRWTESEDIETDPPKFVGYWDDTLLGIGSILDYTSKETTIWGSGIIQQTTKPSPDATYLAVRGPLSRDLIQSHGISCPAVFGDPALLLPRYYARKYSSKYKIGIFPHYVDYEKVLAWYGDYKEIKIINPLNNNITKVLNDLFFCERIISSSLHGVIVSNAYQIPVVWAKFSNKLFGDDSKFHDHFEAVKTKQTFVPLYEKISIEQLHKLAYFVPPEFDTFPLIKAFPIQ